MDFDDYLFLSSEEQVALVLEHGALVGQRSDNYRNMFLYQVHAFYVELAFNKSDGELWRIGPFDHEVFLRPYFGKGDLGELLG